MTLQRRLAWALPAVVVVPMLSGCAALSAKSKAPELPAMNVPPPPPRLIEPAPEPLPEPVAELPAAPPSATATRGTSRPPVSRPAPQPDSKPAESKPADPPPTPPQDPAPVQPPPAPAAQLRTPQTADTTNTERNVRGTIDRASGLLKNIDYRLLNAERKKAYNDSQQYIKQSEDALKEGNLVLAVAMANKAETLAKELAGK